jgi:hypothetical protein
VIASRFSELHGRQGSANVRIMSLRMTEKD